MGLDAVLDYAVIAAIVLMACALNASGPLYHRFPVPRALQYRIRLPIYAAQWPLGIAVVGLLSYPLPILFWVVFFASQLLAAEFLAKRQLVCIAGILEAEHEKRLRAGVDAPLAGGVPVTESGNMKAVTAKAVRQYTGTLKDVTTDYQEKYSSLLRFAFYMLAACMLAGLSLLLHPGLLKVAMLVLASMLASIWVWSHGRIDVQVGNANVDDATFKTLNKVWTDAAASNEPLYDLLAKGTFTASYDADRLRHKLTELAPLFGVIGTGQLAPARAVVIRSSLNYRDANLLLHVFQSSGVDCELQYRQHDE